MKAEPWNHDWQIIPVGKSFDVLHKGAKVGAAWTRQAAENIVEVKRERCPVCHSTNFRRRISGGGTMQTWLCGACPMVMTLDIARAADEQA